MEKVANDNSYAYFLIDDETKQNCREYFDCTVVPAPFTTGTLSTGSGWMFPKRSAFLQIFNHYNLVMQESGTVLRLRREQNRPMYDSKYYFPEPTCEDHEGKPIKLHKSSSLFAILIAGASLSLFTFL